MINVTIENMKNNNDNIVPNQFIIHTPEGEYFQSYNSIIAFSSNHEEGKKTNKS